MEIPKTANKNTCSCLIPEVTLGSVKYFGSEWSKETCSSYKRARGCKMMMVCPYLIGCWINWHTQQEMQLMLLFTEPSVWKQRKAKMIQPLKATLTFQVPSRQSWGKMFGIHLDSSIMVHTVEPHLLDQMLKQQMVLPFFAPTNSSTVKCSKIIACVKSSVIQIQGKEA